jgi:DNA/RNA-binding domain of Phe-tRNA-synthetase-like protein
MIPPVPPSPANPPPPYPERHELPGWELLWARLTLQPGAEADLAALRRRVAERARGFFEPENLAGDSTLAALRRLFRAAGCDPTRYRPSSEALLRRVLKGEELPAIQPLVDINNALSVALAAPCCAMPEGSITPPITLRAGRAGETYDSLRGPLSLAGKPLLADALGPFGSPITDSRRVQVLAETGSAWLVAYLPEGEIDAETALGTLKDLLRQAPAARLDEAGHSPAAG